MRSLTMMELNRFEKGEDGKKNLQHPSNEEMIDIFKGSSYAMYEVRNKKGSELTDYYKKSAKSIIDSIAEDKLIGHTRNDLDFVVFYGEIDDGASIVVTKRQEGQIKVRIWHPQLAKLISGTQSFFNDLKNLEKRAMKLYGYDSLFNNKSIDLKVMESGEFHTIMTGTIERTSWVKRMVSAESFNYSFSNTMSY